MAITGSGQVGLSDLYDEFTGTHSTQEIQLSDYHDMGNAPASGEIQLATDFYGTSASLPAALQLGADAASDPNDYLVFTHATAFDMSDANSWTWEGWFYTKRDHTHSNTSGWRAMLSFAGLGGNIWLRHNSNAVEVNLGSGIDFTTSSSVPLNEWFHLAVVMNGTTVTTYINGTSGGSDTRDSNPIGDITGVTIGAQYTGTADWEGYMDEIRFSNNVRYSSNFTPSTSEFTVDSSTVMLLHMNGVNDGTTFTDSASGTFAFSPLTVTTVNSDAHTDTSYGIGTNNAPS